MVERVQGLVGVAGEGQRDQQGVAPDELGHLVSLADHDRDTGSTRVEALHDVPGDPGASHPAHHDAGHQLASREVPAGGCGLEPPEELVARARDGPEHP
jgi:hypothetical protein